MTDVLGEAERLPLWGVFLFTCVGFLAIYGGMGGLTVLLSRRVWPGRGVGRRLGTGALLPGQLRHEVTGSMVSIFIFGLYGVLTIWMDRVGLATIVWRPRWALLPLELLFLVIWNDIHFYVIHRALHTPWLYRKVHKVHHRSVTPTPWSTYSFHWVESTLLGSVMVTILWAVSLDVMAILLFPLVSLTLNNLGHMNHDLVPGKSTWHLLAASRRHALHHSHVRGNFGFLFPVLDHLLGTAFPAEMEDRPAKQARTSPEGAGS